MNRLLTAIVAASVCCGTAGPALADDLSVSETWTQMLNDVGTFSGRVWSGSGVAITRNEREPTLIDFTTGYTRRGSQVRHWSGARYRTPRTGDGRVLHLMRRSDADWIELERRGEVQMPVPSLALAPDFTPIPPVSVSRFEAGDVVTYHAADLRMTLQFGPDWMTHTAQGLTTTWRITTPQIAAPAGSIVGESDMAAALADLARIRDARTAVRSARKATSRDGLRRSVRRAHGSLRVRATPGGVALIGRGRYLHRTWRLRWDARLGKVRVRVIDRRDADRPPPSRTAEVVPASAATPTGREVTALIDAGAIWTQQQPGVRITANDTLVGSDEGLATVGLDYVRGLTGALDESGAVTQIRREDPIRECSRLTPITAAWQAALDVAGRPHATWSCSREGDTDLAWTPLMGPMGSAFGLLSLRTLFSPELRLDRDGTNSVVTLPTGDSFVVTSHLSGVVMTASTLQSPDEPDLTFRYSYGPQYLSMPARSARISSINLEAARDSLRARAAVRRAAASVRRCADRRIDAGRMPVMAIRRCATRVQTIVTVPYSYVEIHDGARLIVRNRFGLDSRDVVVSPRGDRAVVARVVHRRQT